MNLKRLIAEHERRQDAVHAFATGREVRPEDRHLIQDVMPLDGPRAGVWGRWLCPVGDERLPPVVEEDLIDAGLLSEF